MRQVLSFYFFFVISLQGILPALADIPIDFQEKTPAPLQEQFEYSSKNTSVRLTHSPSRDKGFNEIYLYHPKSGQFIYQNDYNYARSRKSLVPFNNKKAEFLLLNKKGIAPQSDEFQVRLDSETISDGEILSIYYWKQEERETIARLFGNKVSKSFLKFYLYAQSVSQDESMKVTLSRYGKNRLVVNYEGSENTNRFDFRKKTDKKAVIKYFGISKKPNIVAAYQEFRNQSPISQLPPELIEYTIDQMSEPLDALGLIGVNRALHESFTSSHFFQNLRKVNMRDATSNRQVIEKFIDSGFVFDSTTQYSAKLNVNHFFPLEPISQEVFFAVTGKISPSSETDCPTQFTKFSRSEGYCPDLPIKTLSIHKIEKFLNALNTHPVSKEQNCTFSISEDELNFKWIKQLEIAKDLKFATSITSIRDYPRFVTLTPQVTFHRDYCPTGLSLALTKKCLEPKTD
jgi:hypothetical protein